jgi:molecular chaperone IbpA
MTDLMRFNASDLPALLERLNKNSIGMDEYLDRLFKVHENAQNYPPYNVIQVNNVETVLELALAGFKKEEVNVYTEYGKLFVEGTKDEKEIEHQYIHRGVAQRSFKRTWTISDDQEIASVSFEDGLLSIKLGKVIPDHYKRQDWL